VNPRRAPLVVRGYVRAARRRGALALVRERSRPVAGGEGAAAATLVAVYRAANSRVLEGLLAKAGPISLDVRLWALDHPTAHLADLTVGSGPGAKFDLINQLLLARACPPAHPVVIADDDVLIRRGNLARLISVMEKADLHLAQPAHESYSFHTHAMTRRRHLTIAQLSTTVEIGPLFVVRPAWRSQILPFSSDIGLGWGLELAWIALREMGCRIGIVDSVTVVHTRPVGLAYDQRAELRRLEERLRAYGAPGVDVESEMRALLHREQAWRPWQRRAPWLAEGESR
jgi:hypothetical protein